MADKFIRQLTHNTETFERNWSSTFDRLNDFFIDCENENVDVQDYRIKALDALVDYILADSPTEKKETHDAKSIFVRRVVLLCEPDPQPSLVDLVRILRRILDSPNVFNGWYLTFIESIYHQFNLGTYLSEKPSTDLIASILKSFEKQSFLKETSDTECESRWRDFLVTYMFSSLGSISNKLTGEETMLAMRPAFQQLFQRAIRMCSKSNIWLEIGESLQKSLPSLFNCFDNPADVLVIIECSDVLLSQDFIRSLSSSYKENVNQVKTNFSHILKIIERLVLANRIGDARNIIDDTIDVHFKTAVDISTLLQMFIRLCPQLNVDYRNEFCDQIIFPLSINLASEKCNKKLAPLLFDFALVILDLNVIKAPKCALELLEKKEYYPWKELAPKFAHLIRSCAAYDIIDSEDHFADINYLDSIIRLAAERSEVNQTIVQATHDEALRAILRWLGPATSINKMIWCSHVYRMGQYLLDLIDQRQITIEICAQLIEALNKRISKSEEDETSDGLERFFTNVTSKLATYLQQLKSLPENIHREIVSFILAALVLPLKRENGEISFEKEMANTIWLVIGELLTSEKEVRIYEPCIKRIHSLACDDREEDFFEWWSNFWQFMGLKIPDMASEYAEEFLSDVINRKRFDLFAILPDVYLKRPEPFHTRLNELIDGIFSSNQAYSISMSQLFSMIGKEHPELITVNQVDRIFASMKISSKKSNDFILLFEALGFVANTQPSLFHKHRAQLLHHVSEKQNISAFQCLQQYLVASTIVDEGKSANEHLTILINLLKGNPKMKSDTRTQIFHVCQLIGVMNKQALKSKRTDLMAFKSYSECRLLLDFIDGEKLTEENQEAINRTRQEIAQMEKLVIKTGKDVQNITKVVKRQELSVSNLNTRVNTVDTRLNDVNEQLKEHTSEIERIDAKTLSYVPSEWGSQVSKLLNHRADNDWRLLGKRFGYSKSELRHWSMHADPCMSLLNEWFMTNKADEATYGLVKMLDDIGRKDVSKIIRQAATAADKLIPDDMPFEIKRLPPVFLSYQWGTQKAVTTLKQNLEEAGYACWMDIGQMGGGDKLFAKIDAGIRGAKVIVCCMNSAYVESDNCSREVHLAISTGKPLIPLQMEKLKWPPEGALGPIMSEYLYIRFYDRKSNSDNYWPADKFPELLGQIRYHVAPNLDMISSRYQNWFLPRITNLIFLQPTTTEGKNKQISLKDNTPLDVVHPQIMISYQWDRQTDIIALYKRLTELGYRCWLDIFQMGGGDSLFEKIDAGIRNAKCIIACVTPNYTKSTNCRREMSLSDALGKSIIPLLLEATTTWPPAGPMALIFTDKSYIDFCPTNGNYQKNDIWSSLEFNKVLDQLKSIVPEVQTKMATNSIDIKPQSMTVSTPIENGNQPTQTGSAATISPSQLCCIL
ncbi:unnamed protein product [Rotaria socialis]|uniref:Death domain-containing protein n=1 Tax=Rotaria socialis TaxID=392032 RepID=A0A821A6V8_9BILA|nr:unnamed protein product [Rotaria socialis]CAF4573267.1 unnamed protein product [Rotaria socialis]